MTRFSATQFLNKLGTDDSLQKRLVELGAEHGFEFTREHLADSKPGSTAEPLTWKKIAGFPDLDALASAAGSDVAILPRKPAWKSKTSMIAVTGALLYGSLTWYLWRNRRAVT